MSGAFQEKDGSVSMRRILAVFFALAGVALSVLGILKASGSWTIYIPGVACLVVVVLLLFFTTWSAMTKLAEAIRGKSE